jgi:hypothetical protein
MTGEPDSNPGRRPPTIELKATEVDEPAAAPGSGGDSTADTPSQGSSAAPPPDSPSSARRGRARTYAVSAIAGAVAVAAIGAGVWYADLLPWRRTEAPAPAVVPENAAATQPAPSAGGDISARLDKIERAVQAQSNGAAANRVAAAEAQIKRLADSLAALNHRLDDIAAATQSATKAADAAQTAAGAAKAASAQASQSVSQAASEAASRAATQTGVQKSDLDALGNRIAALESAVKALSENATHPAQGADDQAARLTVAAEALRAAVERGAPYRAELAAVQSLGVAADATAPLAPFAADGVPSATALAQQLATLAPALQRAAEPAADQSTFLGRLEAHAEHLVRVTPVEAPAGPEPSAVLARIEIDAGHADLAAALTDMAALPESAKPLAAAWIAKVKAREAALAAARQIAAAALSGLSKPATQ